MLFAYVRTVYLLTVGSLMRVLSVYMHQPHVLDNDGPANTRQRSVHVRI
jgi:hypothetical protein